jgi:integrase
MRAPAIEAANAALKERELPMIPDGENNQARVTFHSLRRTYASLCAEAGIDVAWTAAQIGHVDPRLTINTYTDVRNRRQSPAEKLGSLIQGKPIVTSDHSARNGKTPLQLPSPSDTALQSVESASQGG